MIKYKLVFVDLVKGFETGICPPVIEIYSQIRELFHIPGYLDFAFPSIETADYTDLTISTGHLDFYVSEALNNQGSVRSLCIIFAPAFANDPETLGYLFDQTSNGNGFPREAVAVFLPTINSFVSRVAARLTGSSRQTIQETVRKEMVLRTVCHEFGHLFNLGHDLDFNVMSQDRILLDKLDSFDVSERFQNYKSASRQLCNGHRKMLENAYVDPPFTEWIPWIHPGKQPFINGLSCEGTALTGTGRNIIGEEISQDRLKITLSPNRTYFIGEPVTLEVNFSPFSQSNFFSEVMLEPGYECIEFWLTNPIGERRIFVPVKYICQRNYRDNETGQTNVSVKHNPRLHWGYKGPTFNHIGVFKVEATIHWDGVIYNSNTIEIEVVSPIKPQDQELARCFCDHTIAYYLLLHGPKHLERRVIRRINILLETQSALPPKERTNGASYIAYIRAKSLIERVIYVPTKITIDQLEKTEFQIFKGRKDRLKSSIQKAEELFEHFILLPKKKCKLIDGKPSELGTSSKITAIRLGCLTSSLLGEKQKLKRRKTDLIEYLDEYNAN